MLSLLSVLAVLALSSASPIERRDPVNVQYGPCLTAVCPIITGLTLTTTKLPLQVGADLTCIYADLTALIQTCIFHNDGSLNGGSSSNGCSGATSCASCAQGSQLNAGRCVINQVSVPDLTITVTPTITSTVTKPVSTYTPKVTNIITGTNTLTVTLTATIPNPLGTVTSTKTETKKVTKYPTTVTAKSTKTVTTGTPTNTQYALVLPTDCCPDVYLSLTPVTAATAGLHKRANTITVTALSTVTAVVTDKITLTAAAATVKVTVPAAKVSATISVTAKQKTVTKSSIVTSTITGGPKTTTAYVTKAVPNTSTYTSTITPPNVCPTAGVGLGAVLPGLSPVQAAVKALLLSYQKLSVGIDVLILCGNKLLSLGPTSSL